MRTILACLNIMVLPILMAACSKDPGDGGRAEIRGRLMEQRYSNSTGQPVGSPYPLAGERVYIIYGDGTYHDDDVRTGHDGRFRFTWLRKGTYNVYAISECRDHNGCTMPISLRTSITKRKDVVTLPDITVQQW